MSVNNPSDTGGGGGTDVAFANPPSMTEMDMGAMGAWAEIMAEEQAPTAPPSEKNDGNETKEEQSNEGNEGVIRKQSEQQQQYFAVQVTNLPACTNEELFYHFGGDSVVRDIAFLPDRRCAARIDLYTIEGLKHAKELDGQQFRGRTLRVYEIREDRVRERPIPHDFQNRQFSNEPPPYSRESSRYTSQSSLYSNDARSSYDRGNRSYNSSNDYRNSNQYRGPPLTGTFPRGKYFNNYDEYNNSMGRYSSGGQSYRGSGPYYNHQYGQGGYPPRPRGIQARGGYAGGRGSYYGSQELQRSDSYHHDERDKPAPITRSRTESTAFDAERRRMELSRTSSRLSTSTEEVDGTTPRVCSRTDVVPKKLTNKDIFGEAKPVDTSERLREIEAKQERERLLEQQKYKEEAEAARLTASADHTDGAPTHHTAHQYPVHHGHVAHHANHHQYHHAPSRQGLPPHAPYPYQSHGMLQHSQSHPNARQYHPPQRYDGAGPPEGYRIMRRESADATDASPPLDPVHAKAPLQPSNIKEPEKAQEVVGAEVAPPGAASSGDAPPTSTRRESLSDRRRPNDSMSSSGAETLPRPPGKQRVVYRSKGLSAAPLQKSATIGEIRDAVVPQRGRGPRGGRGGRGYHRGGATNDRRSSFSGVEKPSAVPADLTKSIGPDIDTAEQKQPAEERPLRPERKDHHGSHASLRGSRSGTLRKNRGNYHKDRTPRTSREEDASDVEPRKEPMKTSEEKPERVEKSEKPERVEEKPIAPVSKKEVSKTSTQAIAPTVSNSSTSAQEKKKDRKKANKKETSKGGKTLNNNKFALLIDSED